jgi:hypothetical protein
LTDDKGSYQMIVLNDQDGFMAAFDAWRARWLDRLGSRSAKPPKRAMAACWRSDFWAFTTASVTGAWPGAPQ